MSKRPIPSSGRWRVTDAKTAYSTMQFVPRDNVYVYFRYNGEKTVMVAYNSGNDPVTVSTSAYEERVAGYRQAYDVISGKIVTDIRSFELPAKGCMVWELRP